LVVASCSVAGAPLTDQLMGTGVKGALPSSVARTERKAERLGSSVKVSLPVISSCRFTTMMEYSKLESGPPLHNDEVQNT
jgi:hypothetical protein